MIKAIIFDFDGVIVESVDIKAKAFQRLFEGEGDDIVGKVTDYHLKNGGVSRFEKFRYIYKEFLERHLSEDELQSLCDRFSQLVVDAVVEASFVRGAKDFLEAYYAVYDFYIASATPHAEINKIIDKKNISHYFKKVYGSPQKKIDIVKTILSENALNPQDVIYVGDAVGDHEAAEDNGILFIARINEDNKTLFRDIDCLKTKDLENLQSILTSI